VKLKVIAFDLSEPDPIPKNATVEMTLAEVVAIARVFGAFNDHAHERLGLDGPGIYDTLTGGVLNRYWDEGTAAFGPRIDLRTINDAPE